MDWSFPMTALIALRGGMSQDSDSGNPVKGIWSQTLPNQSSFPATSLSLGDRVSEQEPLHFGTRARHIQYVETLA